MYIGVLTCLGRVTPQSDRLVEAELSETTHSGQLEAPEAEHTTDS